MKHALLAILLAASVPFAATDTSLVLKPTAAQIKAAKPVGNKICPISGDKIGGGMGKGETVIYKGKAVALCCPGCIKDFGKDPAKYLAKAEAEAKGSAAHEGHHTM